MYFTSTTYSDDVTERTFDLDGITGVIWSPTAGPTGSPLLLLGHSGGMHKKAPGLVASALQSVVTYGFSAAAIDAPGHGGRPRTPEDRRWVEAIHHARSAGEPIAPIVAGYAATVAERAVPEWQSVLNAFQALPEIGTDAPIGYGGVDLGVVTGVHLAAVDPRISAASFGGGFLSDALIETASSVTIPVEYRIAWDEDEFDRASGIALFDAFASSDKELYARSGRRYPVPPHERHSSAAFFARHLGRASNPEAQMI